MSEGGEKPGKKIEDLSQRRLEKRREEGARQSPVELAPDGDSLRYNSMYQPEITEAEALEIAQGLVERFSSEQALIDDWDSRQAAGRSLVFDPELSKETPQLVQLSLHTQREATGHFTSEQLRWVLEKYKQEPGYFPATRLLATAEEYIRRFTDQKRPEPIERDI